MSLHSGPVCNRTWDGWLCWEDTEAGFTTNQHCPDYFQDFDTAGLYFAPWLVSPTQWHWTEIIVWLFEVMYESAWLFFVRLLEKCPLLFSTFILVWIKGWKLFSWMDIVLFELMLCWLLRWASVTPIHSSVDSRWLMHYTTHLLFLITRNGIQSVQWNG